jgi:hypothetical protein
MLEEGQRYIFTSEDARKGGQSTSPAKQLAASINAMKRPALINRVADNGLEISALRQIVLLTENDGTDLVSEMVWALERIRSRVEESPNDTELVFKYLKALLEIKYALWGTVGIIHRGLRWEDLKNI